MPTRGHQAPKSKLVTRWLLLRLLTGMCVRSYFQKQKYDSKIGPITKAHPSVDDRSQKTGTLELTASSAGWRVSLPGASIGLNLFQAAWLVSASRQLG